ncbi:hypothetical protein D3C71_436350 [compost metagenome]
MIDIKLSVKTVSHFRIGSIWSIMTTGILKRSISARMEEETVPTVIIPLTASGLISEKISSVEGSVSVIISIPFSFSRAETPSKIGPQYKESRFWNLIFGNRTTMFPFHLLSPSKAGSGMTRLDPFLKYPSSLAAFNIVSLVLSLTPDFPASARETANLDTPTKSAIS